jgi:3-deoxy-D-manno-octulosonic-acid transferase
VGELEAALNAASGAGWRIVVSTTTRTGQALARERFGAERVFYFPLDFAWAVRAYLRVLRPAVLVLMESELWPRMLHECGRGDVAVIVVNARVSDRSFARGVKLRAVWGRVLRRVSLWLAQSEEDARRLVAMGANAESVRAIGNLKYDVRAPKESRVAELIKEAAAGRPIVVAGSTVDDDTSDIWEDDVAIRAWVAKPALDHRALLVVAPRHPEKFKRAELFATPYRHVRASDWNNDEGCSFPLEGDPGWTDQYDEVGIVVLDTIGDLAAVYGIASIAFVGGSLAKRGGHNPLEPAQFGVPVVMGRSYENFRDVVNRMREADGIRIVENEDELETAFIELLSDRDKARAMGERGRKVFEEQQGATGRAVEAIVAMIHTGAKP